MDIVKDIDALVGKSRNSTTMPALFLGHGSPMNAIEENEFVQGFRRVASEIEEPRAVLCISAHWETNGTRVTGMEHPKTIHDFGGFPRKLFEVSYLAPGSPELAEHIISELNPLPVASDLSWGLDHGAWSVLKHLYPDANVPVVQLSLDHNLQPEAHYELAIKLRSFRNKGILILGSGNMVHNLNRIAWDKLETPGFAYDWALEAASFMKKGILDGNIQSLIHYKKAGLAVNMAIPTPEHFLPLIYSLGVSLPSDEITLFNDKPVGGSLTMTSVKFTPRY